MRILLVHNYYQQPGGEDIVFHHEKQLLSRYGHHITEYIDDNKDLRDVARPKAAMQAIWSKASYQKLLLLLKDERPDVVHVHNTFMRISPSIYYACHDFGVPVVQTLHNYRLLCPAATLYRNGKICEDCLGKQFALPGIYHACYRTSRTQTAISATMLMTHHLMKTWRHQVDRYIALTHFAKQKFIEAGFPAEKIVVKSNFVHPDPGMRTQSRNYALYVGRLVPEKGIRLLLDSWQQLTHIPLKVVGDGPLHGEITNRIQTNGQVSIEMLGRQGREEVLALMKEAAFLVFPSEWYEGFPVTIAEAFACSLPVIAADLGAMAEIVVDGHNGLHFTPGSANSLAAKLEWAWTHPEEMHKMGTAARQQYNANYTAEHNYEQLIAIYEQVITVKAQTQVII